jgi:hypothetical protein
VDEQMTYNLTNISRPYELFQTANTITNNYFGSVIALMIFSIAFIYLSTQERPAGYAFAIASYISLVPIILLRVLALVPNWLVYMSILFCLGGVAYTVFNTRD